MSAGNPFRRSRVPVQPDPASANIFDTVRGPSEEAASTTTSQRKDFEPESHSLPNGDPRDTATWGSGGAAVKAHIPETSNGDFKVSESEHESRDVGAGGTRVPHNPFARTLATKEAELGEGSHARLGGEGADQRSKPALDVDAFKNILMGGAPIPAGLSTNSSITRSHHINTDTPSAFDSTYGVLPESPKDVYHEDDSTSEDDEKSELMGTGRSDDLAPPAPPKPKMKGPQTVSFADFDQSIPPGYMSSRSRSPQVNAQQITGILRTASPRPGSDLNKPLPPPPRDAPEKSTPAVPDENGPPPRMIVESPGPPTPPMKAVPPPPPTRKSGTGHGRARSSSNLSNMTSDSVISTQADSVVSTSSNKLAPPPPPTRKPGHQSTIQPSSKDKHPPTTAETKLVPPPPPPLRRLPSRAGKANPTLSRQGSEDGSSVTTHSVPPPPPPRRPGSKRTSIDGAPTSFQRRLSGEHYRGTSFDSERSASISSLQKVAESGESHEQAVVSPATERDILAEMSAFQAEIDALSQAANGK